MGTSFFPNDGDETQSAMYKAYDTNGPAFISLKADPLLEKSITQTPYGSVKKMC